MAETEIKSINGKTLADVTAREKKLDKNQGTENAVKLLYVGSDGSITVLGLGKGLAIQDGVLYVVDISTAVVNSATLDESVLA